MNDQIQTLKIPEMQIKHLNYLVKTYAGLTQLIASTRNRLLAQNLDASYDSMLKGEKNGDKSTDGLESVKGRIARTIEKELKSFPIWELWLKNVPGIGPAIASQLIILFYYRFVPICKKCGGDLEKIEKSMKCKLCGETSKDGLLSYRIEEKDFATISKWWAYMGRHTVEGVMPKRKAGVASNWSTAGRTLGFHIGDQFNRQKDDNPYKMLLNERKGKHQRKNTDWSKGHIHNAAKNEVVKIFLSHFWTVARTIQGKEVSEPYAGALMGHTNIVKPFYWNGMDGVGKMDGTDKTNEDRS